MSKFMKITKNTVTLAQNNYNFILTNEQNLTLNDIHSTEYEGCVVNTSRECMSPCTSLAAITEALPFWTEPNMKVNMEDVKKFEKLG